MTCESSAVIKAVALHGYTAVHHDGYAAKYQHMKNASGSTGVFFICAHGGFVMDPVKTEAQQNARVKEYVSTRANKNSFYPYTASSGQRYVLMNWPTIKAEWKDANTIGVYEGCSSAASMGRLSFRDSIGYKASCPGPSEARWKRFWAELSGQQSNGKHRNVIDAHAVTFANSNVRHQGNGATVLSPAVSKCSPATSIQVGVTTKFSVTFDAAMETLLGGYIPEVVGCDAVVSNAAFTSPYVLNFDVTAKSKGQAAVSMLQTWSVSGDNFFAHLDGNAKPRNTNHVGPNRDDFTWFVDCL
ncbi:MAG: hypothetical protein AAF541_06630 [Pseudomonadota bacterium]